MCNWENDSAPQIKWCARANSKSDVLTCVRCQKNGNEQDKYGPWRFAMQSQEGR